MTETWPRRGLSDAKEDNVGLGVFGASYRGGTNSKVDEWNISPLTNAAGNVSGVDLKISWPKSQKSGKVSKIYHPACSAAPHLSRCQIRAPHWLEIHLRQFFLCSHRLNYFFFKDLLSDARVEWMRLQQQPMSTNIALLRSRPSFSALLYAGKDGIFDLYYD